MRIPISEIQIGAIWTSTGHIKNHKIKIGYFIPDYYFGFNFYQKQGNRVMTFQEFKKEYPFTVNGNVCYRYK